MTKISISVVYSESVKNIWQKKIQLEPNTSVINAIEKSDFFNEFPYFSYNNIQFGVYGLIVDGDTILKDKDRIEIYRELVFDPMQSRRRRAAIKQVLSKKASRRKSAIN